MTAENKPVRRQRRKVLTDNMVAALPRRAKPYFFPDPELPTHGVRVRPAGPSSYLVIVRDVYRKQRWIRIASTAEMDIETSREEARSIIARVKKGLEPREPPKPKPDSVASVTSNWLARHVDKQGLRTAREQHRIVGKYILPTWAERDFVSIRRRDATALLDFVEDNHGARTSDTVATLLGGVARWYVDKGYAPDDYVSPFSRIKARGKRKRSRTLDDDELRAVWHAAGDADAFGALVRLLLLTAQRREKVLTMRWSDITDGTWRIATEEREKGNAGALQLPKAALDIIAAQPRLVGNDFVFAGTGTTGRNVTFNSREKRALDEASGIRDWVLHDLRRTARSLLSRKAVGVPFHAAERVLGHKVGGAVAQTYDQHDYRDEINDALQRLAAEIERIINPPAGNVVPFATATS
jgi:integrase